MSDFGTHDLFVSLDGNDGWSGKLPKPNAEKTDGPLATVGAAQRKVRALRRSAACLGPLTVWIRGGRYRLSKPLQFGPEDSGPTTYAAYPGEQPVFDGGVEITGWSETEVNGVPAWVADVSGLFADAPLLSERTFRSLFVNGRRALRPRLPKEGFYWMAEAPHVPGGQLFEGSDRFRAKPGDIQEWRNHANIDVIVMHFWVEERMPLDAFDPDTGWVRSFCRSIFVLKDDVHNCPAKYYVENVFEALTEPGEWYLDTHESKLYYLPRDGETPQNTTVVAPREQQLLRVQGDLDGGKPVTGLRFEGLAFEHSDWDYETGFGKWIDPYRPHDEWRTRDCFRHFVLANEADPYQEYAAMPQAAFHVPGAVVFQGAEQCAFENCRIAHGGGYGLDLQEGCFSNRIVGNEITDLGAGGLKLDGADFEGNPAWRNGRNQLTDNHIHDGGHVYLSACGVAMLHSFGNTVSHNHIHDFYYTGISCGWIWGFADNISHDNRIEKNHIHDLGKGILSDMGGIYTLGVQPGTVLRGNLIHDIEKSNYGGWAIYPDEGSSHILIENNVCYNTSSTVFHQHYGRENIVRNNIWAFGREGMIQLSRRGEAHNSLTFERNIILSDGQPIHIGGYGHKLAEPNMHSDLNLIWDVAGAPFARQGEETLSVDDLRALGLETHSVVADPQFADPKNADFTLAADSPALALGFVPIDLSDVGPRPPEAR
jgi:hypothetical protein